MHLWTEYEGRTIAESYTLGKLLRSEGRNGFFATADKAGHPAVIRLTEAHFDEEETLSRWRQVAEVHQDNLIEIERVGKTTFDGVALTYALMEPDDANLGDVLKERPLTAAETTQVAKSVAAALHALHTSGLVHEHIEPSNVLAVGETVKLRSDCVRECVADTEFNTPEGCADLRKRDVHAFGMLIVQCLTLEKEWNPALNVPEPFSRLIPHMLDGSWSLEQIATFLDPTASLTKPAAATGAAGAAPASVASPGVTSPAAAAAASAARPSASQAPRPVAASTPAAAPILQPVADRSIPLRSRSLEAAAEEPSRMSMNVIWAVCGVSAVIILLLAWHLLGSKSARPGTAATTPAPAVQTAAATTPGPAATVPATTPAPGSQSAAPAATPDETAAATPARAAHGNGWYVIAFTYNHQGQAQTKADRLNRRHAGLHAEVFSPGGHGPYLVSLNGPMTQEEAEATWRRARREGLPRDTFLRRY